MTRLHATAVALGGRGVVLTGPPGSGKSDLALRLIDRGAILIADDQILAEARDGALWLSPPPAIAGLIEVRGVGLVRVSCASDVPASLLVRLVGPVPRLPEAETVELGGVAIPALTLAPFEASAALKVERALALADAGQGGTHG